MVEECSEIKLIELKQTFVEESEIFRFLQQPNPTRNKKDLNL